MAEENTLNHESLYERPKDMLVPPHIKTFIQQNIDLLFWKIYAKFVNEGIDLSVHQKQYISG
ncbi:hypothetical protein C2G38_2161909 [Gigaspora rosea]|uniref:Uncharacterized protein n=1 Tax=Gigaspora rosea TaxID=44941 RepID=A0A397W021_9GLOM|nr:hypothetical protein C2G38_2161909 [Gigaspora rosea]